MKKMKTILSLLIVLIINTSCESYLSETPDNRTQIDSPDKISELLVNAYPSASYFEFTETMTDNVFDSKALNLTTTNNSQNYNWEVPDSNRDDSPSFYWDACYSAIAHANAALDAIKKLNNTSELNPQKGEALIARAYAHFMLVSLWSPRYDPKTAGTDLGIPYVTETENQLIKNYTRNTVAEVYDFIQKDIEEGLKIITNDYKEPKFHFNIAAAKTFATRFYLSKGDWDKVISLSNDLGNSPVGELRNYQSYLDVDFVTGTRKYSSEDENTNLLIASVSSIYARTFSSNRFQLTGEDRDILFGNNTNIFNKEWLYRPLSYNGQLTIFVPKFTEYFKITDANAGIGFAFNAMVLMSNDEMYLNRIEAHVMTNQLDLANQELQYFHSVRLKDFNPSVDKVTQTLIVSKYPAIADEYTPFYNLTSVQTSYIKAIAELRRKEFIHEGLRWFDIKRFALKITHKTYNQPDNVLSKNDKRKVLQIPLHVLNTGIEKNPR